MTYLAVAFGSIVLLMYLGWLRAVRRPWVFAGIAGAWIVLVTAVGLTGFFTVITQPPRMLLAVAPPTLFVILLMVTRGGKRFIDGLDMRVLTLIQTLRIFVELGLYGLYTYGTIPGEMTFRGGNLDIISGITAPVIFFVAFRPMRPRLLLGWNVVCLGLLLNVTFRAQRYAFGHPGVALPHFPFLLLPAFLVPVVLLAHLAAIRRCVIALRTPA